MLTASKKQTYAIIISLISGVEQSIQKFLDSAKQLESHFLQQRLVLSIRKPEQIVKEVSSFSRA
jgi:hypothetical protein